ncbi:MAG: hypothetical protein H6876_09995 [Hyphomicrobiaceae bacterium]|nr:hypothetical protein [Hyphomicrobiaceae bacterium]MCC0008437.1 hypothetical protein [Hyphomicrobiaceae bacterium]
MTRLAPSSRYRTFAAFAVAATACGGLSMPMLLGSGLGEFSFNSAAVIAATRDSFTLTSPIALPAMPNIRIEAGRLSIASSGSGTLASGTEIATLLAGGKAKLILDDAVLSIAPTQAGGTEPRKLQSLAPILSSLIGMSFSSLQMRNGRVQLGRDDDATESFANVTMEVTRVNSKQVRAYGGMDFRNRPVTFDIVMSTEAELQNAQQQGKATIGRVLDVTIKSELLELKAAGTLSAGDQPQLSSGASTVLVSDLRKLAHWIGLEIGEGGGLGKFEARGPMEFSPTAVAFSDASYVLDGSEATGALTFKWGGSVRPAIDGTLAFKSLDIAPFLKASGGADQTQGVPAFSLARYFALGASDRSPFPLVRQIDADLRISAANVSAGTVQFGRSAASFSMKDGILLADLAELEVGKGGRCGGQFGFEIDNGLPRYSLRGRIEAVDLAALANAFWSYTVLSGAGDVTLDLKAAGRQVTDIVASLHGKVGIRQAGSGQVGLDLKTLAATARAQKQEGWGGSTRGQTAIDGLTADFSLVDGQLVAERVSARAGDATLSAVGSVSFANRVGDVKVYITHPPVEGSKPANDSATSKPATSAAATAATVPGAAGAQPAAKNSDGGTGKEVSGPGGGLHMLGPLDAPEIRFVPLAPASSGATPGQQNSPPVPQPAGKS